MEAKRWLMAVTVVCCVAVAVSGCKRKVGPRSIDDQVAITDVDDGTRGGAGALAPRSDVFEKGARVADKFENVLFEFDSAQVNDSEKTKVEALAGYLKSNPDTVVVLEGNCDERGSSEYNMSLGERRALAVRQSLLTLGIDTARMQTRSFGEEKPANPGHDEEAWRVNRRAEFVVMR